MYLPDDKMLLRSLMNKTAGGLIIPGIAQIAYSLFEVVQLGKGHYDKRIDKIVPLPDGLKIGSKVLVNIGILKEIKYNNEKLFIAPNSEEAIIILDEDESL